MHKSAKNQIVTCKPIGLTRTGHGIGGYAADATRDPNPLDPTRDTAGFTHTHAQHYWLPSRLKKDSPVHLWFSTLPITRQTDMRGHYMIYLQTIKEKYLGKRWQLVCYSCLRSEYKVGKKISAFWGQRKRNLPR